MKTWLLRLGLLVLGIVLGYGLVFSLRFFTTVLPHGGMW
jgi:hypothetical protein